MSLRPNYASALLSSLAGGAVVHFHMKPNVEKLTTDELLEELERRHESFIFVASDEDGDDVFDCNGDPAELFRLIGYASTEAAEDAADQLDDTDPADDYPETVATLGTLRDLLFPVNCRPPVPAPPIVVKVERRSSLMHEDITHVVLESCNPGEVVPDYCEGRIGWGPSDFAGKTFEGTTPSAFRRGRAVIELTPKNRGFDLPDGVTHLVEVRCDIGDTVPEFYREHSGRWAKSAFAGQKMQSWHTKQRRARLARPEEKPAHPKTVEPTFISRIASDASAPKPKPTMTIIDEPARIGSPEKVKPLVSTNFPRLSYRPVGGVRNVRLW